ncbi:MAG: hypothetical protein LUC44_04060, partial [Prevotellaceae bacterium]|nr:hypothetical protein [Prevotellaceae bacterium]
TYDYWPYFGALWFGTTNSYTIRTTANRAGALYWANSEFSGTNNGSYKGSLLQYVYYSTSYNSTTRGDYKPRALPIRCQKEN